MSALAGMADFVRNARMVRRLAEYATVGPEWLRTRAVREDPQGLFDTVHTFVSFIGIGRSGTTLIGSLLDAHRHVVIANQQGVLKYLRPFPFTRSQIFHLLLRNSRDAARAGRVGGGGYSYTVAGQWQGRFDTLHVIGDKSKSGQDVERLSRRPGLLDDLARVTRVRIRMIHVIRNPFDTIATRSRRRRRSPGYIAREYFALQDGLRVLLGQIDDTADHDVARVPVHLEDFVAQPGPQLAAICTRLGVNADGDYLRACAGVVSPRPHTSRYDMSWPSGLVATIQRRMDGIGYLRRYSFET